MSVSQKNYLHYGVNSVLKMGRIRNWMRECQLSSQKGPDSERDAQPPDPYTRGTHPRGASLLLSPGRASLAPAASGRPAKRTQKT